MYSSENGNTEIVKLLLEQDGININAKSVDTLYKVFFSMIQYFKIMNGVYLNYLIQHL